MLLDCASVPSPIAAQMGSDGMHDAHGERRSRPSEGEGRLMLGQVVSPFWPFWTLTARTKRTTAKDKDQERPAWGR